LLGLVYTYLYGLAIDFYGTRNNKMIDNTKDTLMALKKFAGMRKNSMLSPQDDDYHNVMIKTGDIIISKKTRKVCLEDEVLIMHVIVNNILDYLISKEK